MIANNDQAGEIAEPEQNVSQRKQRDWDIMVSHIANLRHLLEVERLKNAQLRERCAALEARGEPPAPEPAGRYEPRLPDFIEVEGKPIVIVNPDPPKAKRAAKGHAQKGRLQPRIREFMQKYGEVTLNQLAAGLSTTYAAVQVAISNGREHVTKRREGQRVFLALAKP